MSQRRIHMHAIAATAALLLICLVALSRSTPVRADNSHHDADDHKNPVVQNATQKVLMGEQVFRFDTFGDEAFWGDTLKLHQAIEGSGFGGVGAGVSPAAALAVGLKVDAEALPASLVGDVRAGRVDLNSPATTLALLKLNAVVG